MWMATKSSYLVRAPGAKAGSDFDGNFWRHWTALMYDLRSLALNAALTWEHYRQLNLELE